MAIDASGVLGSRQLAGVKVNPPGYAALVSLRTHKGFTMQAAEVIARIPRSRLQAAELGPA
jgi:hypothetical protein